MPAHHKGDLPQSLHRFPCLPLAGIAYYQSQHGAAGPQAVRSLPGRRATGWTKRFYHTLHHLSMRGVW
jgi:hypothetical protein